MQIAVRRIRTPIVCGYISGVFVQFHVGDLVVTMDSSDIMIYLAASFAVSVAVGVVGGFYEIFRDARDYKDVWSMLREKYGVASDRFPDTNLQFGVLGKFRIFDQTYLGYIGLIDAGILFRRSFLRRHEVVLFSWEQACDFKIAPDRSRATFRLARTTGLPIDVQIPWSRGLSARRDTIEA